MKKHGFLTHKKGTSKMFNEIILWGHPLIFSHGSDTIIFGRILAFSVIGFLLISPFIITRKKTG